MNKIIFGNRYRWKGKLIRTIIKNNSSIVSLPRKDSMIMAKCEAESLSTYKIKIVAYKNSGNCSIIVNFFGGINQDGKPKTVCIIDEKERTYELNLSTPNFIPGNDIFLRVWKTNGSSGNVFIKSIECELVERKIIEPKIKKESLKEKNKVEIKILAARSKIKKKHKIKENEEMKFMPYDATKRATEEVKKVLVTRAEDVPKVSIITPTRDGLDLIKKCYNAINENTSYPNWEWIVGDSESKDGTEEFFVDLKDPRVKFIKRGTTDGSFSSINNELVKESTGEYVLFLNNDTEPQSFWLYEMMSKIHNKEDIGMVGARLMYNKDQIQHAGIAFVQQGPVNLGKDVLKHFSKDFAYQDRYFQAVTGACMLMRRSDFDLVGGFDPVYYFCYEDVDLCLKVGNQLNKKIICAANAEVIHSESVTQNKHKTGGEKQKEGIRVFKERWMNCIDKDFSSYQKNGNNGLIKKDISFVTCINNMTQYRNYIVGSLFKNKTKKNYEIIPILNFGNKYSAAQALNAGLDKSKGDVVVFCHQDVIFYENWIDMLFSRIDEIEKKTKNWGVLGTAGITIKDDTVGVVHSIKGTIHWQSNKKALFGRVQTVDEHCMIIRKNSGLRFDEKTFDGFHCYGPDICLSAEYKKMENFGIICPLVHDSVSGSLSSGRTEFMRLLNALSEKWGDLFSVIRTSTSVIRKKSVKTFIGFN